MNYGEKFVRFAVSNRLLTAKSAIARDNYALYAENSDCFACLSPSKYKAA